MFSLKILATLIGTSIAASSIAPVRAVENNVAEIANADIISQVNYDNRYGNEPSDGLKNIVGLTGLAIGTGIVGYHVSKAYKPSLANNSFPASNGSSSALITSVNPKLRRELLRLVHNQATANRLLSGTANSHPGRSANWVAEKVIYDLKRDR